MDKKRYQQHSSVWQLAIKKIKCHIFHPTVQPSSLSPIEKGKSKIITSPIILKRAESFD